MISNLSNKQIDFFFFTEQIGKLRFNKGLKRSINGSYISNDRSI